MSSVRDVSVHSTAAMTSDDIAALVAAGESETLEFKKTTGSRGPATKTLCAFLNHRGGRILFGVKRDGTVVGQHVSEKTIEELSDEIRRIHPQVSPAIERVRVDNDREVILVSTDKGSLGPYIYNGNAYRRVGNTTVIISVYEYGQMLFERVHSGQRWENQPATGWSVDDLDMEEIRRTVAEAVRRGRLEEPMSREPTDMLRGLGLLRDGVLLRAAAVLFGNIERVKFDMPQCLLRVARFRGLDRMEFLDNRQFSGNAFTLLANAERFLHEMLPIAGRFEQDSLERIDEPLYPFLAIREALANAFCHRDYSIGGGSVGVAIYDDRLEVTSSGPLHFDLTPEKLFVQHESRPWNPLIARTFFRRGIIEEWGSGTLKMAKLVSRSGLPSPEIEDEGGCVTVRFRHGKMVPKRRKQNEPVELSRKILAMINNAGDGLARRDIRAQMSAGVSERQVRRILEELKESGLIVSVSRGRGARWRPKQTSMA